MPGTVYSLTPVSGFGSLIVGAHEFNSLWASYIYTAPMGGFLAGAFRILVVATQQPTTSWHLFDHLYKNAND